MNHHRTIVNGIFNFAVKRGRFDRNPVAAVRQRPEPPGRERIVSQVEVRTLWDKAEGDREMRAFLALAGTTTMRKGEGLWLRKDRVHLEDAPYARPTRRSLLAKPPSNKLWPWKPNQRRSSICSISSCCARGNLRELHAREGSRSKRRSAICRQPVKGSMPAGSPAEQVPARDAKDI